MADISPLAPTDFGAQMNSFGEGQAQQALQRAQTGLVGQQTQGAAIQNQIAAARAYSAHVSGAVHQYTGRKVVARPDGTYVDEVTGKPVPGIEKSGMTEDQWAQLATKGTELVEQPMNDGSVAKIPRWQAQGGGATSLQDWVMKMAAHGGAPAALGTVSGGPVAAAHAVVRKVGDTAQQAPTGNQPGSAAPGTQGAAVATQAKALADPEYRIPPQYQKPVIGRTPSDVEKKDLDAIGTQRQALYSDAGTSIKAAQRAMTFLKAAQDIVDSKGATVGHWSSIIAQAKRWIPGDWDQTSNYQQLTKYLTNAALLGAKEIYGPKMTQNEVKLQLQEASPNASMNDSALRELLNTNIKNTQYTLAAAHRVGPYLQVKNDPRRFEDWNRQYFPMEDAVVGKGATSEPKPMPSAAKLAKYAQDPAFGGDVEKAKAHLRANGYK